MLTDEQRNDRIIKSNDNQLETFLEFCKTVLTIDFKVKKAEDLMVDCDSPYALDFGGITIMTDEDFNEYEVGYETYDPGGYWEPPSSDYCEYSKHETFHAALFDVLKLYIRDSYTNWGESRYWEEEYERSKEEGYEL